MLTGTKRRPGGPRRAAGRGRAGVVALLAAALLAVAVTGCAGGDGDNGGGVASLSGGSAGQSSTSTTNRQKEQKDAQQGALDFATCMREHGIAMPDPEIDGKGRMRIEVGDAGKPANPAKLKKAEQACRQHLQNGGDGPGRLDPKLQDQMVKFARCMRSHGIDMPDPSPDGGLVFQKGKGAGPDSTRFKEAERACQALLPKLGAKAEDAGGTP